MEINNQDKLNTLERINSWIENCDSKSSIMMALVGVFISMIFTSDFILNSLTEIISTFFVYWKTGKGYFDMSYILILLLFISMVFCLLISLLYLIKALSARTCSKQTGNSQVKTDSLIHFGSIQKLSYNKFKTSILAETDGDKLEDILSQIYINSKRCQEKFDDYNYSIKFIKIGTVLFILFILNLIIK